MREYNFGLRGHDIADNFAGMCEKAKENNVNLLQFALAKTCTDIDFDVVGYDRTVSTVIANKLQKDMLNVAVLGCYINPVETDIKSKELQLARFDNFISYCKDFNARVIGTETGQKNSIEETHSNETYKEFLNSMVPLVQKAEDKQVQIGIEPVWQLTIYSVEMLQKMISDIKSQNISVILDVANLMHTEIFDRQDYVINSAFEKFGDKISTIHLKDYYVVDGEKSFAPTGLGCLNVDLIFKNISFMNKKPDIILDELPLALYSDTVKRLNSKL